jgi:hypothetical protein
MMAMNPNVGVGQHQQPVQPQPTGVMMNVTMPGMVPVPNCNVSFPFDSLKYIERVLLFS